MNNKLAKVMIVDDTPANLQLLNGMLRNQGYQVFCFPRGELAIRGVERNQPDLILLDINMPEMNGFEVCEKLKSDERFRDIPIIFISALNDTSDKLQAFKVGGIDYITKPFQLEEVSARVQTHVQLRHYQKKLLEARCEAEEAAQTKSVFLANMSHEIRTPMTAVLGFLELVLEEAPLLELHRRHLSTAHISAIRLLELINDILDLSKLESDKIELKLRPFNLSRLMKEIYEIMIVNARTKSLDLQLDIDSSLSGAFNGDPLRLRQIIINLLGNAIKFTEQGSVILRIMPAKEEGQLYFIVEDTGIGIPGDKLKHIFEPFAQVDSIATRKFEGTGLGTSISRKLVELMGGKIWVESEEGKGSKFQFKINMASSEQLPEDADLFFMPGQSLMKKSPRRFQVLLAEDAVDNIELVKFRLARQGHHTTVAWNGSEAVEVFEKGNIDVILMDVQMPVMGGVEATRRIRELEAGSAEHIPIIAMTASVMREEAEGYLEVGMDAVIAKPINFNKLFETMEDVVPQGKGVLATEEGYESESKGSELKESELDKSESKESEAELQALKPDSLPGINLQDALYRVEGDWNFLKKQLNRFSHGQANIVEEIESAIASGDRETALRLAHTLKGLSGNIGAKALYKTAEKLESAINAGKQELQELIANVSDSLSVVIAGITSAIQATSENTVVSSGAAQAIDISEVNRLEEKITSLIEECDTEAIRELGRLKKVLRGAALQTELGEIEYLLEEYDFDKAEEAFAKAKIKLAKEL